LSRREFWTMLHQLHHEGLTVVVSTPYMDEAEYATRLGFLHEGRLLDVGTRSEIVGRYPRQLFEVRTADRVGVRARLTGVDAIDDVSLFGTVLHIRSRAGANEMLLPTLQSRLAGLVAADDITRIQPSLEDVFVLHGEEGEVAA
jgi:ABC-2 type transport system ATP-binding protein